MPPETRLTVSPTLGYSINWLRETAPAEFRRHFGVPVEVCTTEVTLELTGEGPFRRTSVTAQVCPSAEEACRRLAGALLGLVPPDEHEHARAVLGELAARIIRQTPAALEKKYSAELSCHSENAARAETIGREVRLELHLPFLDRKQWLRRWEALARVAVEATEDGRLLVSSVETKDHLEKKYAYPSELALSGGLLAALAGQPPPSFTLSYTDRRRLAHWSHHLGPVLRACGFEGLVEPWLEAHRAALRDDLEVSVTLSVPGELVRAWLQAPCERDPEFFPTYAAVSVAVQRAMRRWLPYVYFSDPRRYDDLLAAWPLLVYQAMPPFPGRPKYEFTYDVMDVGSTRLIRRSTLRELTAGLARVRPFLAALGKNKTARFYAPDDAPAILTGVARQPRLLNALLSAEASFVDAFIHLGVRGRACAEAANRDPGRAAKELARFARDFVTTFQRRLRRLYGGRDFLNFGALLLIEATRALNAARGAPAPLSGILRLTADGLEQTFVNAGYRA